MESILNEIRLAYSAPRINAVIESGVVEAPDVPYSLRFGQNEEFFLELPQDIEVPHFPIHHDVRLSEPSKAYQESLRNVIEQVVRLLPSTMRELSHLFDPSETLKPGFYRLYRIQDALYLYILRLDILNRPLETMQLEAGSNDITPSYRTRRLYIESEFIPLESVSREANRIRAFSIRQLVSNTWIGETGKGYQVRGIWMDADLSRFFSKLFLPEGKRIYPFLPFFCKYKTVCAFAPVPEASSRKKLLPLLHRALDFLKPEMDRIQDLIKTSASFETSDVFQEIKRRVPSSWKDFFGGVSVEPYLNARDMKEYKLVYPRS